VIRILSQADLVGEEVWGDGLQLLFRLAEAITQGMTAASPHWQAPAPAGDAAERAGLHRVAGDEPALADGQPAAPAGHAELTAVACLLMLERVNYLLSVEVRLPKEEMVDRLTAIMFAAFHSP